MEKGIWHFSCRVQSRWVGASLLAMRASLLYNISAGEQTQGNDDVEERIQDCNEQLQPSHKNSFIKSSSRNSSRKDRVVRTRPWLAVKQNTKGKPSDRLKILLKRKQIKRTYVRAGRYMWFFAAVSGRGIAANPLFSFSTCKLIKQNQHRRLGFTGTTCLTQFQLLLLFCGAFLRKHFRVVICTKPVAAGGTRGLETRRPASYPLPTPPRRTPAPISPSSALPSPTLPCPRTQPLFLIIHSILNLWSSTGHAECPGFKASLSLVVLIFFYLTNVFHAMLMRCPQRLSLRMELHFGRVCGTVPSKNLSSHDIGHRRHIYQIRNRVNFRS